MALRHTHSHFPIIYAALVSYTLTQAAKLKIVLLTTNTSPPDCGIRFTQTSLTLTNILIAIFFPMSCQLKMTRFSLNDKKWRKNQSGVFLTKKPAKFSILSKTSCEILEAQSRLHVYFVKIIFLERMVYVMPAIFL